MDGAESGGRILGALLSVQDGMARVWKETDGKIYRVPLGRLTEEDQQWIRAYLRGRLDQPEG